MAHSAPVTALHLQGLFLISGDSSGIIKVFDTTNYSTLLEGRVQGKPNEAVSVTSLELIEKP